MFKNNSDVSLKGNSLLFLISPKLENIQSINFWYSSNVEFFNDLNSRGLSVEDVFDYEKFISKVAIDEEIKINKDEQS